MGDERKGGQKEWRRKWTAFINIFPFFCLCLWICQIALEKLYFTTLFRSDLKCLLNLVSS